MPLTVEQREGLCLIRVEGEINIASAAEVKAVLLQALASGTELQLDLERATELDVTAWQLLWAAEREARRSGLGFSLAGLVPREILAAAREAGFGKFPFVADSK